MVAEPIRVTNSVNNAIWFSHGGYPLDPRITPFVNKIFETIYNAINVLSRSCSYCMNYTHNKYNSNCPAKFAVNTYNVKKLVWPTLKACFEICFWKQWNEDVLTNISWLNSVIIVHFTVVNRASWHSTNKTAIGDKPSWSWGNFMNFRVSCLLWF